MHFVHVNCSEYRNPFGSIASRARALPFAVVLFTDAPSFSQLVRKTF